MGLKELLGGKVRLVKGQTIKSHYDGSHGILIYFIIGFEMTVCSTTDILSLLIKCSF